ncbi:MAG: serine/threonine protein kinase [Acidobacteria bacterium]|nr:serine/threonine protein kinase [Acidobacteriota bacterium]
MHLAPGQRLLHLVLVERAGAGGMGEVWRARDEALGRDVAIKFLPEAVSADPERRTRFEREARLLAMLDHPSVARVFGFHEADGIPFLVLEFVEGEDLAERIARGPLPLDEALETAIAVARALEAAHVLGIVHRDLKPANIRRTPTGVVKVLDFGLAKAFAPTEGSPADSSRSPTITFSQTAAGVLLGTVRLRPLRVPDRDARVRGGDPLRHAGLRDPR